MANALGAYSCYFLLWLASHFVAKATRRPPLPLVWYDKPGRPERNITEEVLIEDWVSRMYQEKREAMATWLESLPDPPHVPRRLPSSNRIGRLRRGITVTYSL